MTLTAKVLSGNQVRIPDPQAGEVTVISLKRAQALIEAARRKR